MANTEQTKSLSVLDHGLSVNEFFIDLYNNLLKGDELKKEWKLPEWIFDELIINTIKNIDLEMVSQYQIYHDCGKPYCLVFDEDGKRHFPDHANVSCKKYKEVFGESEYHQEISNLIRDDMLIHLLKNEGVSDFVKNKNCLILLLTGLSEIHANAEMFGGIESVSFKIKWKNINKRGKSIIKKIKEENNNE